MVTGSIEQWQAEMPLRPMASVWFPPRAPIEKLTTKPTKRKTKHENRNRRSRVIVTRKKV